MAEDKNRDYVQAKLITGEYAQVARKALVGYCTCPRHKGCVTKTILKKHSCIEKQCHYFQKNTGCPYWEAVERRNQQKQNRKLALKRSKTEAEQKRLAMIELAQGLADDLGFEIAVLDIRALGEDSYVLFYISALPANDWHRYFDLAREFGGFLHARIELRHAKYPDGSYAVF